LKTLNISHTPYIILFQKGLWLLSSLLIAIWASWHLLAQANFLYPLWYEQGGIKENIAQYASENRYRPDFELTTDDERKQLFAGIVTAIQHQGEGLKWLTYENKTGKIPLLREPEILHLQDVANLITFLNKLLLGIFILWMALSMALFAKRAAFPSLKQAGLFLIGLTFTIAGILINYGAENVFYDFHRWVFPDNHEWFFYYQDSLMSTMMKAPHLFAYIAASLSLVAAIVFSLIVTIFQRSWIK